MNPQNPRLNDLYIQGTSAQMPSEPPTNGLPHPNQQPYAPFACGTPCDGTFVPPYQAPYWPPCTTPIYHCAPPPPPASPSDDGYDQSLISLLLGIICILCFWIPLYSLLTVAGGICGIVFSALGRGKSRRTYGKPAGMCIAAMTVCIIGVALTGLNLLFGAVPLA